MHLRSSFEGLVPLLALKDGVIEKISCLIERLGLEYRMLSRIALGIPRTTGESRLHENITALLRSKSRFISRYVNFQPNADDMLNFGHQPPATRNAKSCSSDGAALQC